MEMAFQTKITKARFTLSPFSAEQMMKIGNTLNDSIKKRIQSGVNANDERAKPLKPGRGNYKAYATYKIQRGLQGIRDWTWSGRTLRSMKVLSVSENGGKIGFTDSHSDKVAHVNNRIEKAFGISPNDRKALNQAVSDMFKTSKLIQFKRVA
jgi:hypothetical protein